MKEKAFLDLAKLAFHHLYEEDDKKLALETMKEAILSQTDDIKQDVQEQFYKILRKTFDFRLIKSHTEIKEELKREIPFPLYTLKEPPTSQANHWEESAEMGPFQLGIAMAQGPRENMEDAHLVHEINFKGLPLYLFAVFDGHGGPSCSQFVARYLPDIFTNELKALNDVAIYNALAQTCVKLDRKWKDLPMQRSYLRDQSGTTATILFIHDKNLWAANVGDSGAVIQQQNKIIQLTEPAKPTDEKYYHEILMRGGYVNWGRTDGTLDMARSIGDIFHPSVSARPSIKKVRLKEPYTIILACDGLWDVMDGEIAFHNIEELNACNAAETLKGLAYTRGTTDNVTVLVIKT